MIAEASCPFYSAIILQRILLFVVTRPLALASADHISSLSSPYFHPQLSSHLAQISQQLGTNPTTMLLPHAALHLLLHLLRAI